MEIYSYGVCKGQVSKPGLIGTAHNGAGAVGGICMEMDTISVTDLPHASNRINGAEICSSDGCYSTEGMKALGPILFHHALEGLQIYSALIIHRNLSYAVVAQAHNVAGLVHGEVGDL